MSDIKNHLGHEDIGSTMIYLRLDLSRRREVQKRFIEYTETILKNDPKIDKLIDWENNKDEILKWLDTLYDCGRSRIHEIPPPVGLNPRFSRPQDSG